MAVFFIVMKRKFFSGHLQWITYFINCKKEGGTATFGTCFITTRKLRLIQKSKAFTSDAAKDSRLLRPRHAGRGRRATVHAWSVRARPVVPALLRGEELAKLTIADRWTASNIHDRLD